MLKIRAYKAQVLLLVMLFSFLSGCGGKDTTGIQQSIRDAMNDTANEAVAEMSPIEKAIGEVKQESEESELPISDLSLSVQFSEADYRAVRAAADDVETVYPYAEMYQIEEALARYRELPEYDGRRELTLLSGETLSPDDLFEIVKRNNDAYFESAGITAYSPLDDEYVLWLCEIISDTLNREQQSFSFPLETQYELEYTLQNLCIFETIHLSSYAAVTPEGYMTVKPTLLESKSAMMDHSEADYMTISHETEHLIQRSAAGRREALGVERIFGFCFIDPGLEVNSLFYNWFIESSAERLAADLYDGVPTGYGTRVGYLDALTLAKVIFRDCEQVQAIPRLTQQHRLDAAFELFGLDSPEAQTEFLNMMYTIEIIQDEPEDFMDSYKTDVLGRESAEYELTDDEIIELKVPLKESVCITIAKYFYDSLSRRLTEGGVTLEDIFFLIAVFEADMNLHLEYDVEGRYPYFKRFLDDYIVVQDEFFRRVSECTDTSPGDIQGCYDIYNAKIVVPLRRAVLGNEKEDISFSFLSGEKNFFMSSFWTRVRFNKTVSIRQMLDIYTQI